MVGAGHAETISTATALNLNIAGVAVIGVGAGSMRPTFTLDTANTSTITVSAKDCSIQNCVFVANFLAVAACFTLTTAKDFAIDRCEFRDTSSVLNFIDLVKMSATSNANDGLSITNCTYLGLATSGAVKLLDALGTHDRVTISDNFYGTPTTGTGAVIPIATGKVLTTVNILRNYFNLVNAAGTGTGLLITTNGSTLTGYIDGNRMQCAATTPLLVTASSGLKFGLNYYTHTADKSGFLVPAADS
jgi:hypothetical protein